MKTIRSGSRPSSPVDCLQCLQLHADTDCWIVGFVFEDGLGLEYGHPEDVVNITNLRNDGMAQRDDSNDTGYDRFAPEDPSQLAAQDEILRELFQTPANTGEVAPQTAINPQYETQALGIDFASPASIFELARRYENRGSINYIISSPLMQVGAGIAISPTNSIQTPGAAPWAKLSRREAFLVHHFVQKIAPWVR